MMATMTQIVFLIAFPVALYALVDCGLRWRACWSAVHEARGPLDGLGAAQTMSIPAQPCDAGDPFPGAPRASGICGGDGGRRSTAPFAQRRSVRPSDLAFAA